MLARIKPTLFKVDLHLKLINSAWIQVPGLLRPVPQVGLHISIASATTLRETYHKVLLSSTPIVLLTSPSRVQKLFGAGLEIPPERFNFRHFVAQRLETLAILADEALKVADFGGCLPWAQNEQHSNGHSTMATLIIAS
jgi:hypothetical protein